MFKVSVSMGKPGKAKSKEVKISLKDLGLDPIALTQVAPAVSEAGVRIFSLFIIKAMQTAFPQAKRRPRPSVVHNYPFEGDHEPGEVERSWYSIAEGVPDASSQLVKSKAGYGSVAEAHSTVEYLLHIMGIGPTRGVGAKVVPMPFVGEDDRPIFVPAEDVKQPKKVDIHGNARTMFASSGILEEIKNRAMNFWATTGSPPTAEVLYQEFKGRVNIVIPQ